MENLFVLMTFASIQSKRGGVVGFVRPKDIQEHYKMSRATSQRYLKKLMENGIVRKMGHGKYVLQDNDDLRAIGECLLTPIDLIEYRTKSILEAGKKVRS